MRGRFASNNKRLLGQACARCAAWIYYLQSPLSAECAEQCNNTCSRNLAAGHSRWPRNEQDNAITPVRGIRQSGHRSRGIRQRRHPAVRQSNNSKESTKKVFRRRAEHNAPKRQGGLCTACLKRAIFNKITDSTPRSVRRLCRAPTEGYWQIVCDRHPRAAGA